MAKGKSRKDVTFTGFAPVGDIARPSLSAKDIASFVADQSVQNEIANLPGPARQAFEQLMKTVPPNFKEVPLHGQQSTTRIND